MKLLKVVAVLLLTLLAIPAVHASNEGDAITSMQIAMAVNSDASLEISEAITYNTNGTGHGIWRAIPQLDNLPNNKQVVYKVTVLEVLQDGQPAQVEYSDDGDYLVLRIGNPDVEITGSHDYVITYSVQGAVADKSPTDPNNNLQLSWDIIGNQWDVPILDATADIWLPSTAASAECVYGPDGSLTPCDNTNEPDALHYSFKNLNAFESATINVQLAATAFTSYTPQTIRDAPDFARDFAAGAPIGLALGLVLATVILFIARRRRQATTTATIKDFVRFEIPRNLRPAEIAAAWHGNLDTKAFTATMLDFATRGIVLLELNESDELVIKRGDPTKPMADWERALLESVLAGQFSATLGEYQPHIAEAVKNASDLLVAQAVTTSIRNPNQSKRRIPQILLAVAAGILTLGSLVFLGLPQVFAVAVIAMSLTLLAALVSIRMIPKQQTQESADFLGEVFGLRKALDTDAGADRRDYVNRTGLDTVGVFATMLPYAVLFGLEKSWSAQFPNLTPEELRSYGYGFVTVGMLNHSIDQAASSLASAMTAPSSSGGDGGGSSSGGGGGGGGGW